MKLNLILIIISLPLLFVSGSLLASNLLEPDTIWWTARGQELPLSNLSSKAEVFINNKPLSQHITDKSLLMQKEKDNFLFVDEQAVTVRINRADEMKAKKLYVNLGLAFMLGLGMALLLIGLILPEASNKQ